LEHFIGQSAVFRDTIASIPRFAQSDASVLIVGESGTGKESCARAVHYLSGRSDRPFIPTNCGAIPDNLFENEFFGHEKGAYTDASRRQRGLVAEANHGTIFLDEVNLLSLQVQVKLLRFLEDGKYRPLGASQDGESNVRVLCATNVDLEAEVAAGRFREDLFYRINVLKLELPPLRKRGDDIPLLAKHFLKKYADLYRRGTMLFANDGIALLERHEWPGNVRELRNIIERAVLMCPFQIVRGHHLSMDTRSVTNGPESIEAFTFAKTAMVSEFEKRYLLAILKAHHGNISQASEVARIDRRSLQRLLKKHNLHVAEAMSQGAV
jgi:DNA-binding NtrC family response regulator